MDKFGKDTNSMFYWNGRNVFGVISKMAVHLLPRYQYDNENGIVIPDEHKIPRHSLKPKKCGNAPTHSKDSKTLIVDVFNEINIIVL